MLYDLLYLSELVHYLLYYLKKVHLRVAANCRVIWSHTVPVFWKLHYSVFETWSGTPHNITITYCACPLRGIHIRKKNPEFPRFINKEWIFTKLSSFPIPKYTSNWVDMWTSHLTFVIAFCWSCDNCDVGFHFNLTLFVARRWRRRRREWLGLPNEFFLR